MDRVWKFRAAALLASAAVFILDAWTKAKFFPIAATSTWSILGGFVRLIDHHNYGISFNIPLPFGITAAIAIAALAWAIWSVWFLASSSELVIGILLGIFIGGVLGNFFDRLTLGFVRDWLLLWGRSAVNLADGAILAGLIGYLVKKPRV